MYREGVVRGGNAMVEGLDILSKIARRAGVDYAALISEINRVAMGSCVSNRLLEMMNRIARKITESSYVVVKLENEVIERSHIDPILADNHVFLLEALNIVDYQKCVCGGGRCSVSPEYTCYEGNIINMAGAFVCSPNERVYSYTRRIYAASGGIPGPTRVFAMGPTYQLDFNGRRIIVIGSFTPDVSLTIDTISLGVYITGYVGTCCETCPADAVGFVTHVPVFTWGVNVSVQAGVTYRVIIYFSVT